MISTKFNFIRNHLKETFNKLKSPIRINDGQMHIMSLSKLNNLVHLMIDNKFKLTSHIHEERSEFFQNSNFFIGKNKTLLNS